ncbi:immunity 49 family protein [Yinghuangia sp. ASG 101]|uniref:immunity 49 family protein n=1 Tax=Yinghuangia sp. ASG 101 TaxID=2896848 RepID=UPI001E30D416|nr:immunity 49 family protein [Yinghuangia sp. ASG 101]UGQ13261.1 immunity 49 family protein [Yinghuangia sp. ASG 101]
MTAVEVPRHRGVAPADDAFIRALEEGVAGGIRSLEKSSRRLSSTVGTALQCLQARLLADPTGSDPGEREDVVTAMDLATALFAAATTPPGGTVEWRIGHATHTVPAAGPRHNADPGNWLTAFWLTAVCRARARMTALADVPMSVLRGTPLRYDEYAYHWVAALQAYTLERPELHEELAIAVDASSPDAAKGTDGELLAGVLRPPIAMVEPLVRGDHDGFNQALADALRAHRTYWTADEDRAKSVGGLLALGPLAVACLAHDAGFPIEVVSGYLPGHFVDGSALGGARSDGDET